MLIVLEKEPDISNSQVLNVMDPGEYGAILTTMEKNKYRLLVVDDDQRILNFTRVKLMMSGFEVYTAMNGQLALEMIESKKPDIVILDLIMPGMSGLKVLQKIRSNSNLPVIAISEADLGQAANRLGANEFMAKPFDPNDLCERIEEILSHGMKEQP